MKNIVLLKNASICQGNHLILSNINLEINSGDFFYLVGKSGSGKSSLVKTLYGDLPFYQGYCKVLDFDMRKIKQSKIHKLRRQIGIVFQDFQLLTDRNIYENLKFVLKCTGWKEKKKIENRILEVLSMVNMENAVYKKSFELSGGEQQRVVIARALLNDPPFIIVDEPTGNLDPKTSEEIMLILQDIHQKGKSILMSTHDYPLISKFQHKILLCEGLSISETKTTFIL